MVVDQQWGGRPCIATRRPPDVIQCVLPVDVEPRPVPGSYVEISGALRPYGGRRTDCYPMELAAQRVQVLSVPGRQVHGQGLDGLDQSRFTFARCLAIAEAQELLADAGLWRVDLPLVVGEEALGGGTTPFRLLHDDEYSLLTVNSLAGHHEYLAAGCPGAYQFSRLYWQHRSANRSFLTEINLIEFSLAAAGRNQIIMLAEQIMERIRNSLSATFSQLARITLPLTGLPQLTFDEAAAHAGTAGVDLHTPHVLPKKAVSAIAEALGSPAFWLIDQPSSTTPYYVKTTAGSDPPVSRAADLYLPEIGEAASGSEWITDPSEVRRDADDLGAQAYLTAVNQGIPAGSGGLSLGLDRLLMFLLGWPGTRDSAVLRQAAPSPPQGTTLTEPYRVAYRPRASLRDAGARMTRTLRWLSGQGFRPCMTSLLAEPWLRMLASDPPVVDYFGHGIALTPSHHPQHHRLLADCPMSVYELGPVAHDGPDFTAPRWTLDVSMVNPDLADLEHLTTTLIQLLTEPGAPLNLTVRPMAAGKSGYFAGQRDGHGLYAAEWLAGDEPVAWAGTWVQSTGDLPHALGDVTGHADLHHLVEFLGAGPPPAGGLTIDVTALHTLNWPQFPLRVPARNQSS
jgi:tRNA synthetases class II (D, K and N)